ncbi:hypothetical protein E4T56_gene1160 [Termitomyces sp. T112]|nr:hypothetical protein E4T56_gene1160 [Termitomyces sp. T112]
MAPLPSSPTPKSTSIWALNTANTSASLGNSFPTSATTSYYNPGVTALCCQCPANSCPILTTSWPNSRECPIHENPVLPDPTYLKPISKVQRKGEDTHAALWHAPKQPYSPTTLPVALQLLPLPEINSPPPNPTIPPPPP